jgi:hypothetical protein
MCPAWPSRPDLSSVLFDYIGALYRQKRHSTLGYLSPEECDNTTLTTPTETPWPQRAAVWLAGVQEVAGGLGLDILLFDRGAVPVPAGEA